MKTTLLALTFTTFALASTLRAEDSKAVNPALLYWQAAAELPQLNEDQATRLSDLAAGRRPFDAAEAKSLLDSKATLHLIRKAADSTADCDWGMPREDGPLMLLPHLSKMRQMSSIAVVQAEALFGEDKVKEGIEWLLVAHRMARHAGAGDMLISNLVQFAIETNVLRAAGRHCLSWDEETRRSYAAMLKSLPPLHTTQTAYRGERIFADWVEERFSRAKVSSQEVEELTKMLTSESKPADKKAIAAELEPGAIHEALREIRSFQSRTEAVLGKSWLESQPELKALAEEVTHSPHFLMRSSYPALISVPDKQYAVATLQRMLEAALQYGRQLDETAAATYRDDFEGEPLRLKKGDDGTLMLIAAGQHPAGKEISLSLGR